MNLDNYPLGSLLIATFVVLSALGVVWIRRFHRLKRLTTHHEVMGYFFPVAGSIYGVLLGMVVVNAISLFDAAQMNVNDEATDLMAIFALADAMPPDHQTTIQNLCINYAASVIENEWQAMDVGTNNLQSRRYAIDLFKGIIKAADFNPIVGPELLATGHSLLRERRERIDSAMREIPSVEWITLCIGGVLVILFSYLFVLDSIFVQITSTVIIATMIALNLYLVILFGNPFSGDLKVSDFPFRNALAFFKEHD